MKGLKREDIEKMDKSARVAKLKELRLELIRSRVKGRETKNATKEIKKAIARVLTVTNAGRRNPVGTA